MVANRKSVKPLFVINFCISLYVGINIIIQNSDKIMNPEIENFSFVQASLHWTFMAITEIGFLNKARSVQEIELINSPPFTFYRISLHYMFTMEYMKLMESNNDRYPNNHIASLEKFSDAVCKEVIDFVELHNQNLQVLKSIRSSDFYTKLKGDRDKKFGHADSDYQEYFSFRSFSDNEIETAITQLNMFKSIMDNCTSIFDSEFVFQHIDPRTDNFIRFHARYKDYYFNNYFDAIAKGYGLW